MALSVCPKCDWHLFEVMETQPYKSSVRVNFVQCAKCGAVVGVVDASIEGAIKDMQARLQRMEREIEFIESRVRQR